MAALTAALSLGVLSLSSTAQAAALTIDQCNNVGPGPMGATTGMTCSVTVVNTISGGTTSSTTTVSRQCSLDPCAPGNGSTTTSSSDLVTTISQCNGSDNDAAHPIDCTVTVTNNISADTPGALPVTPATVNQCVGSAGGGGGTINCAPFPASTTNATVTQCNGSANGGGGTVNCTVDPSSTVSAAIPLKVNQCNGTGNPGGTVLTCRTKVTTNITAAAAPTPTATASPSPTATVSASPSASASPAATAPSAAGGSPSAAPAPAPVAPVVPTSSRPGTNTPAGVTGPRGPTQVTRVPTGGVQAGGGSTAGLQHVGLLAVGGILLLAGACAAVPRRRTRQT